MVDTNVVINFLKNPATAIICENSCNNPPEFIKGIRQGGPICPELSRKNSIAQKNYIYTYSIIIWRPQDPVFFNFIYLSNDCVKNYKLDVLT